MKRSLFNRHPAWYAFNAKGKDAEVLIYDEIGFFGVTAQQFVKDLRAINADTLNVRMNTPGGSVMDGVTIFNALKDFDGRVVTHIDGLAASIGSIIALAGEEVRMAKNAFYMIHDPFGLVVGDAAEMRKMADVLDKIGGTMAETYADKTGMDEDAVRNLMAEETWYTASEALDAGFVDTVSGESDAKAHFDLSVFAHVPKDLLTRSEQVTERDLEAALRDAGLSRAEAKTVLARGYNGQDQRDAGSADVNQRDAGDTELAAAFAQLSATISN